MKRKRNHIEETFSSEGKKFRLDEDNENSHPTEYNNEADVSAEEKKEDFVLTREIAENEVLSDITGNNWRIGAPIGKGSFGEIFLASDDVRQIVDVTNAQYVTKIEPHSNGPLFVEIHCLLNVNKQPSDEDVNDTTIQLPDDTGIPKYIASGSHFFNDSRYRFLIMPRYKTDLHSIIKAGRLSSKHFLTVASQIINVLMHLHSKHYVHSDIKAENIMIGLVKAVKHEKKQSRNSIYNQMMRSHYLRPSRSVTYDENSRSSHTPDTDHSDEEDEDFELSPRKRKGRPRRRKPVKPAPTKAAKNLFYKPLDPPPVTDDHDDRVFVIDYGLATKFVNTNGEHKPFCCDERRAHDGTLEFTSRDAHFGAHSRRSDLECLGYNLIYWSQGFLPWKDEKLREQPEFVHRLKEVFMTDVKEMMKLIYGKDVPRYLGEFMHYVGQLEFDEEPNYEFLKGLFEKEFVKLGYKKSEMKLNINEMREESEPIDKSLTENDLMMASITDLKTARKLGFLIATDCVDGNENQLKSNEAINLNVSCKASPKNLRSKEKGKGKRPKRAPKVTEKELIIEKMAQGKKLSIAEIATLDPSQIVRDRADREYEKFDEKINCQTPQRYEGNPTYAILEIENRLKNRQSGIAPPTEIETIKGYTKPMMDVLKKQQMMVEQQITPVIGQRLKRSREGLRNVIKPTRKNLLNRKPVKKTRNVRSKLIDSDENEVPQAPEVDEVSEVEAEPVPRRKRGRPVKQKKIVVTKPPDQDDTTNDVEEVEKVVKRKRGRPKTIRNVIEPPETEEDSVYYDIPGEGSNDGVKEISEDENQPEILPQKRSRRVTPSDENSAQESIVKRRGRYYADVDYDATEDETSNLSSISNITKSSASFRPRRVRQTLSRDRGIIVTRNKIKSRSTSRTAATLTEITDQSEASENDSEYEIQSGDETGEEIEEQVKDFEQSETEEEEEEVTESEMADDSNDSNDSIDIKYSPIKTRARKRVNHFNLKQIRGRRINVINENSARNFRLVSTQG